MSITLQISGDRQQSLARYLWPGVYFALVAALYAPVLAALAKDWWNNPDYGHGFFVPLFSCYVLYREREKRINAAIKPSNFGLLVILGGVGLLILGSMGAEFFTSRLSLLILLAGIVLFLSGRDVLRAIFFPLGFLIFMIPLPAIIQNEITFPLQILASRLASSSLEVLGVPVLRDGNILILSNYSLEVVEACSGLRSLMTLIALAIAYGYLAEPRLWARCVLVLSMVPIAIATNALRITTAGALAHRFGPSAAEGFLHEFSGWVIFLVALSLMLIGHHILLRLAKPRAAATHA